jgi:hypothetical protein
MALLAAEYKERYMVAFDTASGHGRVDSTHVMRMPLGPSVKLPLREKYA